MTDVVPSHALSPGAWTIDPVASSIEFTVGHWMVTKVRGRFESFSGVITVDDDGVPSVSADMAVGSITTGSRMLDAGMRKRDFFDVENFPTATFASTAVRESTDTYVVDGKLTVKGVTKRVCLDLHFDGVRRDGRGEVAHFRASGMLKRKDFNVDTGLSVNTAGVLIGLNVAIAITVLAVRDS